MRTLSTTILSLLVLPLMAQITIDQGNFPRPAAFIDAGYDASVTGVAVPSEGQGQTWDYSGLVATDPFTYTYLDAAADTDFPDALNYRNTTFVFQAFGMLGRVYEGLDATGWYDLGRVIEDTTHSITAISGGANDVLNFPDQVSPYGGTFDILSFPMSYADSWTPEYIEYTQYNLTVAAFGLNNVPGLQKRYISQTRTVVGEGALIIPNAQGNPSGPLDALLLKVDNHTRVDSFFLGGQLAPAPLMAAFGLTQGAVSTLSGAYVFYVPGYGKTALAITLNSSSEISAISYRPDVAGLATSIADASVPEMMRAFPNPVEAGGTLHFGLHNDGTTLVELTDVTGRTLITTSVAGNGTVGRLDIPSSIMPGIYTLVTRHLSTGNVRTQKVSIR